MKQIIVTIEDGAAVVTTKGFAGSACKAETADLEKALGKTTTDVPTAEMRSAPAATLKAGA